MSTCRHRSRIAVAMAGRQIALRVGGQTYRVVTTASEEELRQLAAVVDAQLALVAPPGRPVTPHSMLLAAIALAHEAKEQRSRADALAVRAQDACGKILARVDEVLGPLEAEGGSGNDETQSAASP